jgi:hypothetical protein
LSIFKSLTSATEKEPALPADPRTAFARVIEEEFRAQGHIGRLVFDLENFTLLFKDGKNGGACLATAFAQYQSVQTPEAKQEIVQDIVRRHCRSLQAGPEDFESVRYRIIPIVRERSFFEFLKLQFQIEGRESGSPEYRPIAENLCVCVAVKSPDGNRYVNENRLAKWGVSFDEACQVAHQNLSGASQVPFARERTGVYIGPWQDGNVPSRLLLPEIIRKLNVLGAPVAVAPNRNTLIVTGSEDISGQRVMLGLAQEAFKNARPMAPWPLILRATEWLSYFPESGTPLFADYASLRLQTLEWEYAQQKPLLDRLYEKIGVDTFIASFHCIRNEKTKKQESYTIWNRGAPTLLPRSDLIFLVDPEKPKGEKIVCKAYWDQAAALLSNLMRAQDMFPERFYVADFPEPALVEKLRGEALD